MAEEEEYNLLYCTDLAVEARMPATASNTNCKPDEYRPSGFNLAVASNLVYDAQYLKPSHMPSGHLDDVRRVLTL